MLWLHYDVITTSLPVKASFVGELTLEEKIELYFSHIKYQKVSTFYTGIIIIIIAI